MITTEQKYAVVDEYKPHTESVVKSTQKQFLPVFSTGKIFVTDRYHYMDREYGFAYSAEEPEKAYTIIRVSNLPYRSLYKRKSHQSFTASMERMIYDKEIVPFILFVNNRFVPWNKIDIIYNYGDTYLKLHDTKYYKDLIGDLKILVLPYNIAYLSTEPDYSFNTNYDALKSYINESATIKGADLYVNLPDINTDYNYDRYTYNIGYWMYNQIRLRKFGLLSSDRINKLRSIPVVKKTEIKTYNTTINAFDRDSYVQGIYDSICNIDKTSILFRFNSNGELDNNGTEIIYLVDKSEIKLTKFNFTGNSYYGKVNDASQTFPENYIVFKNGCICNDYSIDVAKYNNFKIYNIDKTNDFSNVGLPIKSVDNNNVVVYNFIANTSHMCTFKDDFNNDSYIQDNYTKYFKTGIDPVGYMNKLGEALDFNITHSRVYEDNYNDGFEAIMNYNPLYYNKLFETKMQSVCYTGAEANKLIFTIHRDSYNYTGKTDANGDPKLELVHIDKKGLKIPKLRFDKDHETYIIIYLNGKIISNYNELVYNVNYFFLPKEDKFANDDILEVLYFKNVNNNELIIDKFKSVDHCYPQSINKNDLKLFSTDVSDLLTYTEPEYDLDRIAFPVYKRDASNNISIISNKMVGRKVIAVSSHKFVYQRLVIDRKTYKVLLEKRFRYCDNPKQYYLFINGRLIPRDKFLITIPKVSRPFDKMYIYTTIFFNPTDQLDLFYLPEDYIDINTSQAITIKPNGYIECTRGVLDYPLDPDFYLFVINGKKIPRSSMIPVSTNMIRLTKDTATTDTLEIYPIVKTSLPEVTQFISSNTKSKYETLIDFIKGMDTLGYNELDKLFQEYVKISNIESKVKYEVARIAIINEIVRDFWVTSGYDYNNKPFVYDYYLDDYITKDANGNYIIPALDALPEINIIKYDLHHLYYLVGDATHEDFTGSKYFEYGDSFVNPLFKWAYNDNYNTENIEYQKFNGTNIPIKANDYTYQYRLAATVNMNSTVKSFTVEAFNGFNDCSSTININFCNGIYYGLVDEDLLDTRKSDIYTKNPTKLLRDITKLIQPQKEIDLVDIIIGNNKYFIYALPKRLLYKDGKQDITFYLPDINSEEVMKANRDDKTTPILTDGTYLAGVMTPDANGNYQFSGQLKSLDSYKMEKMVEFKYTNVFGYTEDYVIFKSNGYFTRLYDNTKFSIHIR